MPSEGSNAIPRMVRFCSCVESGYDIRDKLINDLIVSVQGQPSDSPELSSNVQSTVGTERQDR